MGPLCARIEDRTLKTGQIGLMLDLEERFHRMSPEDQKSNEFFQI